MSDYTFITIHTLVDLGDGHTSLIDDHGCITTTANLARLVDNVICFSYPFVTRVESFAVDLSTTKNKSFYKMPLYEGSNRRMYMFKFTVTDIDIDALRKRLDNIPVVIPTIIPIYKDELRICRFITSGPKRNTTISASSFE